MNYELLATCMLVLMAVALLGALVAVVWATTTALRKRSGGVPRQENHVPLRRIVAGVAAGTLLIGVLSFLLGSSETIVVNGRTYDDGLWLRAADMFIVTAGVLLVVGAVAYAYSELRGGAFGRRSVKINKSKREGA